MHESTELLKSLARQPQLLGHVCRLYNDVVDIYRDPRKTYFRALDIQFEPRL